jgi:hypothetical protein
MGCRLIECMGMRWAYCVLESADDSTKILPCLIMRKKDAGDKKPVAFLVKLGYTALLFCLDTKK